MPLSLDENNAQFQIRGYQPGTLQVNDQQYHHSLIVTPTRLIEPWTTHTITELTSEDFAIFYELKPNILLLGTGQTLHFPELKIYGDLLNNGTNIEVMDTRAACFTYNALTAENRNVAAALLI